MITKIRQNGIDIFSNQNFNVSRGYSFLVYPNHNQSNNSRRYQTKVYSSLEGVINGKIFYDQPIDSDVKRYEEIRKLTTGQG